MKNETQPKRTQGILRVIMNVALKSMVNITNGTGKTIARTVYGKYNKKEAETNAQRIVTAVNEYEALKKKADMHDELLLLAKTISEALHDKEQKKLSVFEMSILDASDTLLKKAIQK